MFNRVPCSEISFRSEFYGRESRKSPRIPKFTIWKKNTKLSPFFFPLLRLKLRQKTQSPDPWRPGARMARAISDGQMAPCMRPVAWGCGCLQDISCINYNGRLLEACSKPWLHFQDDIFWVSPVSLFWDLTRMAFHNVAGRVCWQWHQRLWRLQMGAGRRVRVWITTFPDLGALGIHPTSTYWFCTYHLDEFCQKKANERYQRIECL